MLISNHKATNYMEFFDYLDFEMEHICTLFAEIYILRYFSVRRQLWLSSSFTDQPSGQVYSFAFFSDLEQMVQHPYILGSVGDTPNIFDVFLTSTLSAHSFKLFPLFGLLPPQPNFCTLSCLFCTVSRPAGKGMLLASCFSSVGYFFDFQDSSSVCARAKTEVIVSGMEAHTRLYHTDRDLAQSVNPQVSSDFF